MRQLLDGQSRVTMLLLFSKGISILCNVMNLSLEIGVMTRTLDDDRTAKILWKF
jgi:hypothetical protein